MPFIFFTVGIGAIEDDYLDVSDLSNENILPSSAETTSPFNLSVRFDGVQSTEIKKGYFKKDDVRFAEGEVELGMVFYYDKDYKEGAQAAVSYTSTLLEWKNNPWFEQDRFNTFTLSLAAFTERLHKWFWRAQLNINIDANNCNIGDYGFYDLLLWGRYEFCKNVGVHLGFIAQTGMRMDRVYPIFGFDWKISNNWKLSLVFPVNMALEYTLNSCWSVALAARTFDFRHRVGKHQCHARWLVRYQNTGAELAVNYKNSRLSANIHAGYALGGKVTISTPTNNHPRHYRLEAAPYAGAEVIVNF